MEGKPDEIDGKDSEEGYIVEAARDRAAAMQKLDTGAWDVVLLDQKLEGPGGPDSGFD